MKIKMNKEESKIIDDATTAIYWLLQSEPDVPEWDRTFKKFRKLLRDKFILEPKQSPQ